MKQLLLAASAKIVEFIESEWVIEIDDLRAQSICDSEFVSMATIWSTHVDTTDLGVTLPALFIYSLGYLCHSL